MNITEVMKARHSVRQYLDKPVETEALTAIKEEIEACNREGGLNIQLVTDEPKAFSGFMAKYGKFSGVTNYIALVGPKSSDLGQKCGYYGERLVLLAQQLGLNTCWVAMSYKKIPEAFKINSGEKLTVVISLGYGTNQGEEHKSKEASQVSNITEESPDWFKRGVEAALLAPTAMNQQKFNFTLTEDNENDKCMVEAETGKGFYTDIDLGIAKYHFEIAAGTDNFSWK